jgi:hypothetical protein
MSKGITTAGAPGFIPILVFIFLVLVTAIPTSARAQEQAFTLTDAVHYALEHNNEIRAASSFPPRKMTSGWPGATSFRR